MAQPLFQCLFILKSKIFYLPFLISWNQKNHSSIFIFQCVSLEEFYNNIHKRSLFQADVRQGRCVIVTYIISLEFL